VAALSAKAVNDVRNRYVRVSLLSATQAAVKILLRVVDEHLREAKKRRDEAGVGLRRCAEFLRLPVPSAMQGELLARAWQYYVAEDPERNYRGFAAWAKEATPLDPETASRLPLARVANRAHDYEACLDLVKPLLAGEYGAVPQDECLLLAGIAAARLERIPETFRYLSQLTKDYPLSPRAPRALLLLAWAHLVQREPKKAMVPLQDLLKRFPRARETRAAKRLLDGIATRAKQEKELF
jgi:hypothetical protein